MKFRLIFYSPSSASVLAGVMSGGHVLLDPFSTGLLPCLQAIVSVFFLRQAAADWFGPMTAAVYIE